MSEKLREVVAKWRKVPNGEDLGSGYEEGARDQLQNCADELEAALAGKPAPDEVAWLIERDGLCLGFCEHKFSWVTFTNIQAFRFSRRSDAIRFIEASKVCGMDLSNVLVTEHSWSKT